MTQKYCGTAAELLQKGGKDLYNYGFEVEGKAQKALLILV